MDTMIHCPHCGQQYQPDPELLNFEVQCSTCGKNFLFSRQRPQQPPTGYKEKSSSKNVSRKICIFFLVLIAAVAALITWVILLPPANNDHLEIEIMMLKDAGEYEKAFKIASEAAERNIPIAQYELAQMYHNGHGVRANFQEYVKWLKKAIDNDGFFYPQLYSQKEQEERAKKALKYGSITEKYKAASVLQDEDAFRKVLKMFPRNLMVKNDELIELKKENNDKKIKELLAEDFRCIPFYVLLHIRDRLKPREPIQLSGEELDLLNKFIEQAKNSPKPHLFYLQIAKLYTGYGGYPENPELAEKYLNLAIGNNNEYNARYRKALYYLSKKDIASARRVADELLSEGYCVFFYNMPDDIKPHYMNKYNENHANFIKELKQGK